MTTKEEMSSWFRARFEIANKAISHDDSESGFNYAPGSGPINVSVALQEQFPHADLNEIEDAAQDLANAGPWLDVRE